VPGITAALAMASSLGVSLTHRDAARSLRFVTGHSRDGALPKDLDWRAVADPSTTTVFYMGGRTAAAIAATLIANGLSPATPAALASAVSRPNERHWAGRLDSLCRAMDEIGTDEPVLIGVGQVFAALEHAFRSKPKAA